MPGTSMLKLGEGGQQVLVEEVGAVPVVPVLVDGVRPSSMSVGDCEDPGPEPVLVAGERAQSPEATEDLTGEIRSKD